VITECPACGEPLERDDDRIITDECFSCGWSTPDRKANNRLNDAKFLYEKAVSALAQQIYEYQRHYDEDCEMSVGPLWENLHPDEKAPYVLRARLVLDSHEAFWRGKLIAVREAKRKRLAESPLYEPGEIPDDQLEEEAMELYNKENTVRVESGEQSGFMPWWDTTVTVRDSYRARAARAIRARRGAPAAR
jgi:hypothetical protein